MTPPTDSLAHRLTIAEVVRVYNEAIAEARDAFRRVAAAEKLLNETFTDGTHGSISFNRHGRHLDFERPEDVFLGIRHDVWGALVDRLEIRRMMSNARWVELQRQLERKELPEITHDSVSELVAGFASNLDVMLGEAVEEVFDWLRPRHSRHKTNTELEVGEKVILGYVVEKWEKWRSSWAVNYRAEQSLTALENVFSALDGQGQITKTHYSAISTCIRTPGFSGEGETPYFRFKVFQNSNMHLWFKRADLLERFNRIAGGRRLRPGTPGEGEAAE